MTAAAGQTMETVRETEKKYCSISLTLAVMAGIVCFMFSLDPAGKGIILGSLFSAGNFIMMGETLPMRIGHSRRKGAGISFLLIMSRYALMAIPLAVSIKQAEFSMPATVLGLFTVQIVIMTDHIFNKAKTDFRRKQGL